MKNMPSTFLKQIFSSLLTVVKSRAMMVKGKTRAIKARLLIFNLLRNKKVLMSAINHKIHALLGQEMGVNRSGEDCGKAIVLYSNAAKEDAMAAERGGEDGRDDDDDDYPDLRHSLFDPEDEDGDDELVNGTGSVIEMWRNSREDGGREFSLEDEIDRVADVFIRRFHRQMRIQKQDSFKRYKEMLARGV